MKNTSRLDPLITSIKAPSRTLIKPYCPLFARLKHHAEVLQGLSFFYQVGIKKLTSPELRYAAFGIIAFAVGVPLAA
jgi:hypothetical protein